MHKYHANLKLPFVADMETAVRSSGNGNKRALGHFQFDPLDIDQQVIQILSDCGIRVTHQEVFFTPPHSVLAVHVDGKALSNLVKLNWCWGGKGSKMMWWEPKPGIQMTTNQTVVGTPYLFIKQKDCRMIEMATIMQPTLVNVGTPHSVINTGSEERWVLSLVLGAVERPENLEWDEAIERLKKYLA